MSPAILCKRLPCAPPRFYTMRGGAADWPAASSARPPPLSIGWRGRPSGRCRFLRPHPAPLPFPQARGGPAGRSRRELSAPGREALLPHAPRSLLTVVHRFFYFIFLSHDRLSPAAGPRAGPCPSHAPGADRRRLCSGTRGEFRVGTACSRSDEGCVASKCLRNQSPEAVNAARPQPPCIFNARPPTCVSASITLIPNPILCQFRASFQSPG